MYLEHLQNWLVYGLGLLIFLLLALFWLSGTSEIWGFRAFPGERIRVGVKYFRQYLSQVQVLFQIYKYKYKYSQYLDCIKYIKYFFNQVQVQVPSTLVTNNSTVSLVPNSFTTITLVHTVTCKVRNTFQICTKITFILWNQPWIDKLCICHPIQLMDHVINHRRSWLLVIASMKILQT